MKLVNEYIPRSGIWYDIYRICMNSKNGKKLYLSVKNGWYDKEGKLHRIHEWTWDRNIGIQFDYEKDAEEYAKSYFKNFNGWYIDAHEEYHPM